LINLPVTPSTFSILLKLTTAVLMAGDMALWMGPGRKIIEKSWETPEYGIRLSGSLAELEWGGWKMIAVPSLTKAIPRLLESAHGLVLHLLASLRRDGKLWALDSTCRRVLEEHMCVRLGQWEMRDEVVSIWRHFRWVDLRPRAHSFFF
jgi:U3 small nucleolar RNA-associated protein 20